MKKTITLALILFLVFQTVYAQLGRTRTEIIGDYGNTFYKTGTSKVGEPYILYQKQDSTITSGIFNEIVGFYFKQETDGTNYCNEEVIMDPLSELNYWVKYYKSNYREIGSMKFMDDKNKVIFQVTVVNNSCAIRIWYE